jgi:hypothetical protein
MKLCSVDVPVKSSFSVTRLLIVDWVPPQDVSFPDVGQLTHKKVWNYGRYPKSLSVGRYADHASKRISRKAYRCASRFVRLLQKHLIPARFVRKLFGERIVANPPDRGCAYLLRPFMRFLVIDSLQRFAAPRSAAIRGKVVVGECRHTLYRQFAATGFAGKDRKKKSGDESMSLARALM